MGNATRITEIENDEIVTALEQGGELLVNSESIFLSASSSHLTIRVLPEESNQYFPGGVFEIKIPLTDKEVAFSLKPKRSPVTVLEEEE